VAVPHHLHGELYIPVKDIQMVTKPLQVFCSMRPDDKNVINIMEPAQTFVLACANVFSSIKKLAMTGERAESH